MDRPAWSARHLAGIGAGALALLAVGLIARKAGI
jgi:hypothetical protein